MPLVTANLLFRAGKFPLGGANLPPAMAIWRARTAHGSARQQRRVEVRDDGTLGGFATAADVRPSGDGQRRRATAMA